MANEEGGLAPEADGGRTRRLFPVIVVALLMGVEGVGVFFLAKAISPTPVAVLAAGVEGEDGADSTGKNALIEVELADCRPSNMMGGKFITFDMRVSGLVAAEDVERAERLIRAKRARLEDGVNTVIRSAEPKHLNEPKLTTIKRRLKYEFDEIFGDDQLIKEVLIPKWLQSRRGV